MPVRKTPTIRATPPWARRVAPALEAGAHPGLEGHQHRGQGDEGGHGRLEHAVGQAEEEDGPDQPAGQGGRAELDEPAPLPDQLAPVGHGGADVARDQADVVGHVGQHRADSPGPAGWGR